ncbi:MAG: cobalamin B12-binding domain-containing protein [Moorella humiferrea]|uniref:Methionine synthase n=1 Tax=Neomoorella humiferrea TaxID=676965 RepID=A0A2T0ASX5_9FIRM|nr:cobalamin-dependent protein [Moorella humiferrea]MBE3572897.1 cobalamin B12-binding domain-containing protein [Moorella humiferrea]PRR73311.1 Methionine synthase [Moorella humiferrea]
MQKDALARAMAELEEAQVDALVKEFLDAGAAPLEIVKALQEGMVEVGSRFESGDYFLSELVMAGEIMKNAMDILEPYLKGEGTGHKGTIVIGTVKGDIHDLGKNIVIMLLKGAGYNVVDLGVDVPKEKFVEAVKETGAPLVGMSVLLTSCQAALKETVEAIHDAGLYPKVVIGGNYVDEAVKKYAGADYFATTAGDGLRVAAEVFGA